MVDQTGPTSTGRDAPWALEATLVSLLRQTKTSSELLRRMAEHSKVKVDDISALNGTLGTNNDLLDTANANQGRVIGANNQLRNALLNSSRTMTDIMGQNPGSMFSTIGTEAAIFAHRLASTAPGFSKLLGIVAAFAEVMSLAYGRVADLSTTYRQSYNTGIVFEGGMRGLNRAVFDTGMSLKDLTDAMAKNSAAIAVLGTRRAANLSVEFARISANGAEFGMTLQEATDTAYQYADMQLATGRTMRLSDKELATGAAEFAYKLNEVSQITGKRADQIREELKQTQKNPMLNLYQSIMSDTQRQAYLSNQVLFTAMGESGKEFQEMLATVGTVGMSGLTKIQRDMISMGGVTQQELQRMEQLSKTEGPEAAEELKQRMSAFGESMQKLATNNGHLLVGPMRDTILGFQKMATDSRNLTKLGPQVRKPPDEQQKRFEAARTEFNQNMETLNSAFSDLALHTLPILMPAINVFTWVIKKLTGVVSGAIEIFESIGDMLPNFGAGGTGNVMTGATIAGIFLLVSKSLTLPIARSGIALLTKMLAPVMAWGSRGLGALAEVAPLKAASSMLGKATEGFKELLRKFTGGGAAGGAGSGIFEWFKNLGSGLVSAVKSIGSFFGDALVGVTEYLRKIVGNLAGALSDVMSNLSKGLGDAIGNLSKGLGAALTNIGKGIGDAVGSIGSGVGMALGKILEGLAIGIGAFANPKILIGAGILGLSITLIGAGIAGATWLVGTALPTLAEGMDSFTKIDGDALSRTGMGMQQVALGLAAISAGKLVDSFASFGTTLVNFVTRNDPIKNLMRFAEVADPLAKAGDAMERFATSYEKMANALNLSINTGAFDQLARINVSLPSLLGAAAMAAIAAPAAAAVAATPTTTPTTPGGQATAEEERRERDRKHRESVDLLRAMVDKLNELIDTENSNTRSLARAYQTGAGVVY